jgi:hypothetical protein
VVSQVRRGKIVTVIGRGAVTGVRLARCTGLAKTGLEHAIAATALNLIRLDVLRTGCSLNRTCITHVQRLKGSSFGLAREGGAVTGTLRLSGRSRVFG